MSSSEFPDAAQPAGGDEFLFAWSSRISPIHTSFTLPLAGLADFFLRSLTHEASLPKLVLIGYVLTNARQTLLGSGNLRSVLGGLTNLFVRRLNRTVVPVHRRDRFQPLQQSEGLLESLGRETDGESAQTFDWLQNSVFTKTKGTAKIYYPALPPEKLKVSVEMKFAKKRNSFTFHGIMVWFRHVTKGVYRMGVHFEEGQDIHIYQDKNGELVISVFWKASDL